MAAYFIVFDIELGPTRWYARTPKNGTKNTKASHIYHLPPET